MKREHLQTRVIASSRFGALREGPRNFSKLLVRGHRDRAKFSGAQAFCFFVGYPRSGHTLIGAILNAHRNAVIAHELNVPDLVARGYRRNQIFSLILKRDRKFTRNGSVGEGYDYAIPGQWQGRFEPLKVIGDKRGGAASRAFAADPTLMPRLARLIKLPLRIIHVVRNPWDNIATISRRHEMDLAVAAQYYFAMCDSATRITRELSDREVFTLRYEEFLDNPIHRLAALCRFLDLPIYPGYVEDCAALVWKAPVGARKGGAWPEALRDEVAERAVGYPHLAGYRFDVGT